MVLDLLVGACLSEHCTRGKNADRGCTVQGIFRLRSTAFGTVLPIPPCMRMLLWDLPVYDGCDCLSNLFVFENAALGLLDDCSVIRNHIDSA